ncbi:MAG: hypothetical protein AB7H93_12145 [Vicinamibacterales bacterium]
MPEETIEQLKADLAAEKAKIAGFRDNNIALLREVEPLRALKQQFDGLDAEKVRADLAELATLRQQPPADAARITALETQLAAATATAAGATLRTLVGDAFLKTGGRPEALDFVLGKARDLFDVRDGQPEARVFSPNRPGEKLSIDEFIAAQTKASAFAFFPSSGGGASPLPAGGGSAPSGVREVVDPTPAQLGQLGDAIKAGTVRLKFTK